MNWCVIQAALVGIGQFIVIMFSGILAAFLIGTIKDKLSRSKLWGHLTKHSNKIGNFVAIVFALTLVSGIIFAMANKWYIAHCGM